MATIAEKVISDLKIGILPTEQSVKLLCQKARDCLIEDSNVIILQSPITIVGDIHGQFYDLLELFEISGACPDVNFCFLGDYVDRGYHGVETFIMLLALKVRYPTKVTLLRGNHESRALTQVYGFYDECLKKYGNHIVYKFCTCIFDLLPLAAVVEDLFLVHGGISPGLDKISDINSISRIQELDKSELMTNLCWSDPCSDIVDGEWAVSVRGLGYTFGNNAVKKFNYNNDMDCIVRAHQVCSEGYEYMFNRGVLTIFSAANYCYRCGNKAAILEVSDLMGRNIKQFDAIKDQIRSNDPIKLPPGYFL